MSLNILTDTTIDMTTLTEDEALVLYHRLSAMFGWAGTFFTREDAATAWETPGEMGITDDEWDAVCSQYEWRKGLQDVLTERGWDLVFAAVEAAKAQIRSAE